MAPAEDVSPSLPSKLLKKGCAEGQSPIAGGLGVSPTPMKSGLPLPGQSLS